VVLFELLTGQRLREITDEVAGWTHAASGAVPSVRALRPDLPPVIRALLDRALAADPAARFSDCSAFGAAIREALSALNAPVGASDLATLIRALDPPRKPRILTTERSKVIRLGPEARALREAIEAPTTPAPIPIAVPPRKTAPLPTLAVAAPSATVDFSATPAPPPRARTQTPRTPPAGRDRRPSSPSLPSNGTNGVPVQQMSRVPTRQTPVAPQSALRLSPAQGLPRPSSPGFPAPLPPPRQPRETARVQPLRARPRWQLPLAIGVVLLVIVGVAIHHFVVPLDVLLAWRSPARLAIATEPEGASLRLDGMALGAASPVVVQVQRDLADHVIEATRPGFKPARVIMRYDKSVMLSSRLVLQRDPLAAHVGPPVMRQPTYVRAPAPPPPPVRTAGKSKRSR
jgi:hypothetical protein